MPWEAELIKNIPVSKGWSEDLLIWSLTPNGHYSVRSAYHMLSEGESRQEPSSSSSEIHIRFGRAFGKSELRIKYDILYGVLQEIRCPLNKI